MVTCPGPILESTKGIKMKLDLYIGGSERKCSVQEPLS